MKLLSSFIVMDDLGIYYEKTGGMAINCHTSFSIYMIL